MKKLICLLLALASLCLFLPACSDGAKEVNIDISALAAELASSVTFADELEPVDTDVIAALYGFSDAKSVVVYAASGATPEEIIVAEYETQEGAAAALGTLNNRLSSQKTTFNDYNTQYRPLLDKSIVRQIGRYVVYCVSSDYDKSVEILNKYIG